MGKNQGRWPLGVAVSATPCFRSRAWVRHPRPRWQGRRPRGVEDKVFMSEQGKKRIRAARATALAAALGAASLASGCVGYQGDFDRGYQVDDQTLSQIKIGATTKPEALYILGTPSTTSTVGGDA